MFNRKRLDRERLEIYLVHLLLAYRPLVLIGGLLLLLYADSVMLSSLYSGLVLVVVAALPLLMATSYRFLVLTARLGAWIATLGRND